MVNRCGVVLAAAALWSCSEGASLGRDDHAIVAKVGSMPIYVDEFKREFHRVRLADDDGAPTAQSDQAQKKVLIDDLINRRLLLRDAERLNLMVSIEEVEAAYKRSRGGWEEGAFDALLQEKDLTAAEYKRELRERLLTRKYFREEVFSRIAVTDEEIVQYVKDHPEIIAIPEQVHARHIVVKSEEEAAAVLKEVQKSLAFEDAAIKYSLSPDGQSGGDLGYISRGVMPKVFDDAAFSLPVGVLSKVVASDYGYHLIKVIDKRAAHNKTPDEVRNEVEIILRRDKERQAQAQKIAELRKGVKIQVKEAEIARIH